ncbi:hypothetical protein GGR54DRAFT_625318 [Hypoxylon sp. NC1633]|nr:hypothetical protein GGR54DRAFT_625318 [Hypoxylon sp. NC1633]
MFQGADAAVLARDSPSQSLALRTLNAYDDSIPDKCVIGVATTKGGHCQTFVQCEKPSNQRMDPTVSLPWDDCRIDYLQYFYHELVGNFSVVFTKADGDSLHDPVIAFEALNEWAPLVIEDQIKSQDDGTWGKGNLCKKGKDSITNTDSPLFSDNAFDGTAGLLYWKCGFPKLQKASSSAFGVTLMNNDADKPGFTPGWCTVHVTQYQRNEYGNKGNYAFAVQIYDGVGDQIGHVQKATTDSEGHLSVSSKLPFTLVIDAGPNDRSAVHFAYGGQFWTCDSTYASTQTGNSCTLGAGKVYGWENGDRSGDMGFDC